MFLGGWFSNKIETLQILAWIAFKSSRKYFVHLIWIKLASNPCWLDSSIGRAADRSPEGASSSLLELTFTVDFGSINVLSLWWGWWLKYQSDGRRVDQIESTIGDELYLPPLPRAAWDDEPITSTMTFRAVSAPRLNSVPGTLLLIVAGITAMGIRNAWNRSRFSVSSIPLWYACRIRKKHEP